MKTLLRKALPFIAPIIFVGALLILRRELENYHYRDLVEEFHRLDVMQVLAALGFTVLSYLTISIAEKLAGIYAGTRLPFRDILPISFICTAVGNNFGNALIAGGSLRARLYSSEGLGALEISKIVFLFSLGFWMGYLALAGSVFVLAPPPAAEYLNLGPNTVRSLGGLGLVAVAGYILIAALFRRPLVIGRIELPRLPLRIVVPQVLLCAADLMCAAAVLYCLLPSGSVPPFSAFLGLYLLGLVAGIISQVPGGVGVFETAMIVLLQGQVEAAEAVGALLLFRGIYYLIPFAISACLLAGIELRHRRESPRQAGETRIELQAFTLEGRHRRHQRDVMHQLEDERCESEIVGATSVPAPPTGLPAISDD